MMESECKKFLFKGEKYMILPKPQQKILEVTRKNKKSVCFGFC